MKIEHEIRRNEDGSLDEFLAWGWIHLEQMSDQHWWIGVDTLDGKLFHINISAKNHRSHVQAIIEAEGESTLAEEMLQARPPIKQVIDDPPGLWGPSDLRRAFVEGAAWWEFDKTGGTIWRSDRDRAEEEAERRYPGGKIRP